MASIIPPKKPRKPGMPKISIPLRPSSSGSSSNVSQSQKQYGAPSSQFIRTDACQQPAAAPYAAGPSRLRESLDVHPHPHPHGHPHAYDDGYEGHLPSYSNAASIYPDTVPAGPLTDHQALTNDLRRAIGDGGAGTRDTEAAYGGYDGGTDASRTRDGAGPDSQAQAPQLPPLLVRQASEEQQRRRSSGETAQGRGSNGGGDASTTTASRDSIDGRRSSSERVPEDDLVLKGNIETLARLGEGASGEVRKARHKPTGMVMAVKVGSARQGGAV